MIFRTGSILIVGNCEEDLLHQIYEFLKKILEKEYKNVAIGKASEKRVKNVNKKCKRKMIYVKSN
jgi:chorismate mutase